MSHVDEFAYLMSLPNIHIQFLKTFDLNLSLEYDSKKQFLEQIEYYKVQSNHRIAQLQLYRDLGKELNFLFQGQRLLAQTC